MPCPQPQRQLCEPKILAVIQNTCAAPMFTYAAPMRDCIGCPFTRRHHCCTLLLRSPLQTIPPATVLSRHPDCHSVPDGSRECSLHKTHKGHEGGGVKQEKCICTQTHALKHNMVRIFRCNVHDNADRGRKCRQCGKLCRPAWLFLFAGNPALTHIAALIATPSIS